MKTVNIYALTRVSDEKNIKRLERQMSWRPGYLTVKRWEIESVCKLVEQLAKESNSVKYMEFYYSYQIPKLGKEFDLLRISDEYVINIELKSEEVSDQLILKQLTQNRYYLSTLCRPVHSYTYISSVNRLVRLSNSGHIIDTEWPLLQKDLDSQIDCYVGNIEELFKEENYIISPLAEVDRFLRHDYFLTSQQRDIENKILKKIAYGGCTFQGFTGSPGTGKTLLLYDIAMKLSERQSICIFHCGVFSEELKCLDERLKRVDFFPGRNVDEMPDISSYSAILVDEGHKLDLNMPDKLKRYASMHNIPVIFTYDCEDNISREEIGEYVVDKMESLPGFTRYRLTNRIRANGELSSFVNSLMKASRYNHRRSYPSVSINYSNNSIELDDLLAGYKKQGYKYLDYSDLVEKEFEKVVMVIDSSFWYDNLGYLRAFREGEGPSKVRELFYGLSRAKKEIALIVLDNEEVFDELLTIVQGRVD